VTGTYPGRSGSKGDWRVIFPDLARRVWKEGGRGSILFSTLFGSPGRKEQEAELRKKMTGREEGTV